MSAPEPNWPHLTVANLRYKVNDMDGRLTRGEDSLVKAKEDIEMINWRLYSQYARIQETKRSVVYLLFVVLICLFMGYCWCAIENRARLSVDAERLGMKKLAVDAKLRKLKDYLDVIGMKKLAADVKLRKLKDDWFLQVFDMLTHLIDA